MSSYDDRRTTDIEYGSICGTALGVVAMSLLTPRPAGAKACHRARYCCGVVLSFRLFYPAVVVWLRVRIGARGLSNEID